jgi:nucleoside-diphosphate-sugar epimerase
LGAAAETRLRGSEHVARLVPIADATRGDLCDRLAGVDTVVHLDIELAPDAAPELRRARNVDATAAVVSAATVAGVARVVLLSSALVYGAFADNPTPLSGGDPIRAIAERSLLGDFLAIEALAADSDPRGRPAMTVLRPAVLVGRGADGPLTRYFDAPRLLAVRGAEPHWQFCHVDDLLAAVELAALGKVSGPAPVGCDGWLTQEDVERATGKHRIELPAAVAFATAERLHRVGLTSAPASELQYLVHPCVVACDELKAAGWAPAYDNEGALRAHVAQSRHDHTGGWRRGDAARAAAGAAVAVAGTVALARRAAKTRRRRA